MYTSDGHDKVVEILEMPRPEPGAPCPLVLASEHAVVVSYWTVETMPPEEYVPTVQIAFVTFQRPHAHHFGPPNEEAIAGHPLASLGLFPFACFRINTSSWIRQLEKMNSVHHNHLVAAFAALRHFVITFHDSTFECVAQGFVANVLNIHQNDIVPRMVDALRGEDESQRPI